MCWKSNSPMYSSSVQPYTQTPQETFQVKHCSNCGTALVQDYRFCPHCGKEANRTRKGAENQCTCGAMFEPKEKYCFSCGKSRRN